MSLAKFTERWTSAAYPPDAVSEPDLRSVERHFGLTLPDDYRRAMLLTGVPRPTIALLDAIVDRALDVNDLSDLYSPAEIIRQTRDFRAFGMPDHLIAIASDCSGNQFCFDATELKAGSADGPAIWFFDHDFGTTAKIAPDFEAWIDAFCAIEPSDPT